MLDKHWVQRVFRPLLVISCLLCSRLMLVPINHVIYFLLVKIRHWLLYNNTFKIIAKSVGLHVLSIPVVNVFGFVGVYPCKHSILNKSASL